MPESRYKLEQTSWLAVVQAYQVCTRQYTRLLAAYDLTVAQFDAMARINELHTEQQPVTPHKIADAMLVTRGNLTGLLKRLCERGLVQTEPHPEDGRSIICQLTSSGRQLLTKARKASAAFIEAQLAPFDDQALAHTRRQMHDMAAHLNTLDPQQFTDGADAPRSTGT